MNDIEKIAINTRSNVVKKPTTIEEQIELLKSREVAANTKKAVIPHLICSVQFSLFMALFS